MALQGVPLQNQLLSTNPCPKCVEASDQEPMTLEEWAASVWGLPGSEGRYCGDFCHCVLAPADVLAEFPELDLNVKLRGEDGSEIGAVVDIGPAEEGLKDAMDEWNRTRGKLPKEIYDMPLDEIEGYLRKLMKGGAKAGGGVLRGADAYFNGKINFGGEIMTRGQAVRLMREDGLSDKAIETYLMGNKGLD